MPKRKRPMRRRTTKKTSARFIRNVVNNTIMEKKNHQLNHPAQTVAAGLQFNNLFDVPQHQIGTGVPQPDYYRMGNKVHATGLNFRIQLQSASATYPNRVRFILYQPRYDQADIHPNVNMYANLDYKNFKILKDFSINVPITSNTTAIKIINVSVKLNKNLHYSGVAGSTLQSHAPKLLLCAASTAANTSVSGQSNAWYTDA